MGLCLGRVDLEEKATLQGCNCRFLRDAPVSTIVARRTIVTRGKMPNSGICVASNTTLNGVVVFWVHCQHIMDPLEAEYTDVRYCFVKFVCGSKVM